MKSIGGQPNGCMTAIQTEELPKTATRLCKHKITSTSDLVRRRGGKKYSTVQSRV